MHRRALSTNLDPGVDDQEKRIQPAPSEPSKDGMPRLDTLSAADTIRGGRDRAKQKNLCYFAF